ncbi:2-amino-4-hydroxy-6-hydroxymethyldihydropteridine diphosphokinase [Robiginitomaculum antarcticum]|uniref:2-amino-4-hydroxy-6- hydroxymethyldihydropteridine diphosphokinase n=1 Tax=Robiginitomaculum antarcticum TaxID=437507 RepID=UPI00037A12DD|nr:2-amino-4-hydroxy-6-hydroxymethyldihydropteridine diphosphokinase [Robiginitomaculum antarcticum]
MSVFIAIGANMPSLIKGVTRAPAQSFEYAAGQMRRLGIVITHKSRLWQSPSWPSGRGYPNFVNAVWKVETDLLPEDLLKTLKSIEREMGREASQKNAPRVIDLDIIDYNGLQLKTGDLTLPHPRMTDRAFVLFPLAQISPDWRHPESGMSIWEAIARLPSDDGLSCVPRP